jgi:hypothetical protein
LHLHPACRPLAKASDPDGAEHLGAEPLRGEPRRPTRAHTEKPSERPPLTRGSVKIELNRGDRETRQPHLCRNRNDPSTDTRITTPHTLLSVATIEPTPQRANSVGDQYNASKPAHTESACSSASQHRPRSRGQLSLKPESRCHPETRHGAKSNRYPVGTKTRVPPPSRANAKETPTRI